MATPQSVAEEALQAVRNLRLPAWNWPNVPKADQLRKTLDDHTIIVANQLGLIKPDTDTVLEKVSKMIRGVPPSRQQINRPTLDQAFQVGEYFASGQCRVLNCGERTNIALAVAKKHRQTVGAVYLQMKNHEFLMLTSTNFFQSYQGFLPADAQQIAGPPDAWICDPWYWFDNCRSAAEAGVAYPIADWPNWGPAILKAANDPGPPWNASIVLGFLPDGPAASPSPSIGAHRNN